MATQRFTYANLKVAADRNRAERERTLVETTENLIDLTVEGDVVIMTSETERPA